MKVVFSAHNLKKKNYNINRRELAILKGVEKARQHYNSTHTPSLSVPKDEKGQHIRLLVNISKIIKKLFPHK